jgi:hypothetical protein
VAQAYETQLQMTEAVEEVELLRLRLDIAEQVSWPATLRISLPLARPAKRLAAAP